MPCEAAAIFKLPNMGSNPVEAIPAQIAGDHRQTRNPQSLIKENHNLLRLKMVEKEIAGDNIEAGRSERQRKSVAGDPAELLARAVHVSQSTVEDRGAKLHFGSQILSNGQNHIAGSASHVQDRQ